MQFRTSPGALTSTLLAGLFAYFLGNAAAFANDSPTNGSAPTEASIRELLELSDAHKLVDGMKAPLNAFIAKTMQDAAQGKEISPDKQAVLDRMRAKMIAALDEVFDWDHLLPMYIKTYQESLTQQELDGMTAFYKTPAGQAVVKKMPLIMQNIMGQMAGLMKPFQQRVQQIQQETLQELDKLNTAPKASSSSLPRVSAGRC